MFLLQQFFAHSQDYRQPGEPSRPTYEAFRVDRLASEADVNPTGDLAFSLPILVVPNRHGHDWQIKLDYHSNITQRQRAGWVGLGWSLEVGSIERTILGRSDDQTRGLPNGELGSGPGIFDRSENWGRLWDYHNKNASAATKDSFDVADVYRLNIDGEGMELLPFPATVPSATSDSFKVSSGSFLPIQYRPWLIRALDWPNGSNQIRRFCLRKEDGTQYFFDTTGIDRVKVQTLYGELLPQNFTYPYRWNLTSVIYPDGVVTTIEHSYQNMLPDGGFAHTWDQVQIDRNRNFRDTPNSFGRLDLPPASDGEARFEYSRPYKIQTETHYAIFYCAIPSNESTDRNCRLDSIRLFDRKANSWQRTVRFSYASSTNGADTLNPTHAWQTNEKLNMDQQTLISVTIVGADGSNLPPYEFSYLNNPRVSPSWLTSHSIGFQRDNPTISCPGYWSDLDGQGYADAFAAAWRLGKVKLPTGGTIEYTYERINSVCYDPEGEYRAPGSTNWAYKMQPRSRLKAKTVSNDLGETRIWTYDYGTALFDWPSRVNSSTYVPSIYRSPMFSDYPTNNNFYQLFKGCPIVHRWVKVTAPDSSTRRVHYTTSYCGEDANALERQPDSLWATWDPNQICITKVWSRAGRRGMVWKEVLNDIDSTQYVYSYREEGGMLDRYEYFRFYGPGTAKHFVYNTSIWARQDSVVTVHDGVTSRKAIAYYSSPREDSTCGGGVAKVTEVCYPFSRVTSHGYASQRYSAMANRGMLAQPYADTISRTGGGKWDETIRKTTWKHLTTPDVYVPEAEWATTDCIDSIAVNRYDAYDAFANVTRSIDANGDTTTYTYGSYDTPSGSQAYENAYLRRISSAVGSTLLNRDFEYTASGKVKKITDENGNAYQFQYDGLSRLKNASGPDGSTTNTFLYHLHLEGEGNWLDQKSFRSSIDSTETIIFADNLGNPYQTQVGFGPKAIVKHTVYDPLWRALKEFKPYILTSGLIRDAQVQQHDSTYYAQQSVPTGARPFTSFVYDRFGRILEQHAPGSAFDTDTTIVKTRYSTNVFADSVGYPIGVLFKTTTINENRVVSQEFRDHLGNLVCARGDSAGLRLATRFMHDARGNVTGTVRPSGAVSSFLFDARGLLTSKTTPEQGNVQILYDKEGNLRFVKDSAHTGTASNSVAIVPGGYVHAPYSASGQFSLGMPGRVILTTTVYDIDESEYITVRIKANNTILLQTSSVQWSGSSATIFLPKGTYSYEVQTYGSYGAYSYSITANTGFEFIYRKYDALNRMVELGEYESNSLSGNFTRANAENISFPTSNRVVAAALFYDTASTDQLVAGLQRNLLGKISTAKTYRFGQPVLTSFYSYDSYGRQEWVVQSGEAIGSYARKIAYLYDLQGNVRKKTFIDYFSSLNAFSVWYEYDGAGRLSRVYSGSDSLSRVREADYTYYANGHIDTLRYATADTVDHDYNERDWLTSLRSLRFEEQLGYNLLSEIGSQQQPKKQFNGNISWLTHRTDGVTFGSGGNLATWVGQSFRYDSIGRLKGADFGAKAVSGGTWYGTSAYDLPHISYDADGNIDSLTRNNSTGSPMDRLKYHYPAWNSNIVDSLLAVSTDFVDSGWDPLTNIHISVQTDVDADNAIIYNEGYGSETVKKFRIGLWGPAHLPRTGDTLRIIASTNVSYRDTSGGGNKAQGGSLIGPLRPWNPDSTSVYVTLKLFEDSCGQQVLRASWNFTIWSNQNPSIIVGSIPVSTLKDMTRLHVEYDVTDWSAKVDYVSVASIVGTKIYSVTALISKLTYVSDTVSDTVSSYDLDNQPANNYAYDGNGNAQQDLKNGVAFILYGIDNLPVTLYKTSGSVASYWYDQAGNRVRKSDGSTTSHYILDLGGQPFVVINPATPTKPTYYVYGLDLLAQASRDSVSLTRYGYLKDHLGSIRASVKGGVSMLSDDFGGNLSNWTTTAGSGYAIENGELSASSSGQNILVNASSKLLSNGVVTVSVKAVGSAADDPSVIVRYQDVNNFYFVRPYTSTLQIWERANGSYYSRANMSIGTSIVQGQWYTLKIVLSGNTISAYWNGSSTPTTQWTNATRASGKVGFLQIGPRHVHWDNVVVLDTTNVGQLAASDDYDPWGMILEGRSTNQGMSDARFKFTGKERDVESQYDCFGARYYDSRIGRWLAVDPLAEEYPWWSPFAYVGANPLAYVDADGNELTRVIYGSANVIVDSRIANQTYETLSALAWYGLEKEINESYREKWQQEWYYKTKGEGDISLDAVSSGLSNHEAGFALDINWNKLSIAKQKLLRKLMTRLGWKQGKNRETMHWSKDPKDFGYVDRLQAIRENRRDRMDREGNLPVLVDGASGYRNRYYEFSEHWVFIVEIGDIVPGPYPPEE